jgi:hypothetical protein
MRRDDPSAFAPTRKKRRSWGLFVFLVLLLLVGAVLAVAYEGPFYVKRRMADAARRSGLTVSVGEIVFRPRELVLQDTKVVVPGLAGTTVTVGEVEVAFEGIEPRGISVRGFEVALSGDFAENHARIVAWARALASPLRFDARSGHIHWSNPWGTGTELEASDVTLSTLSGFALASPSVLLGVPSTKLGPWKVKYDQTSTHMNVAVGLDPASPAAAWKFTEGKDHHVSISIDVPLSPLSRIGIPPESLGLAVDPYVELHVSLDAPEPPKATGKLTLNLSNLRAGPPKPGNEHPEGEHPAADHKPGALPTTASDAAATSTDVQLMTGLSGSLGDPLTLTDGLIALGPNKGKVLGTLAVDDASIRASLSLQWAPKRPLPLVFALDTHDVWGTGRH